MTSKPLVGMALAILTAGVVLTACGNAGNSTGASPSTTTSATHAADHNQADVTFAQQMIPHHQQALDMARTVAGHTTNAKVTDLAGRIEKAQDPEIQQMTGWLNQWGAAPSTTSGMPGMGTMPGMGDGRAMPGMMSDQDMQQLSQAKGAGFDKMWLQMMVQHHQGAVDMAKTELAQGASADAKTLAQKIIDGQQAEITEMKGLLGQS
jgi:uncharacterized protein (DUF305 family)